jgi:hypothetical protein
MITLVPILLLLLFALVVFFLGRFRLSLGSTWLLTATAVLVIWVGFIILRFILPGALTITDWNPIGVGSNALVFQITKQNWIYGFLLLSLLVGVIFTDTVRLKQGDSLVTWTGSLVLAAVGLLAISSKSFIVVVFTWTLIDITEFAILIRVINHPRVHQAAMVELVARIGGTLLTIGGLSIAQANALTLENTLITSGYFFIILLGTILRLGVVPLHIPFTANLPIRRSLGTILRFASPLAVISFLAQITPPEISGSNLSVIIILALITSTYGAIRWVIAKNELVGRPYWMLSFSGLIVLSIINQQIETLIALTTIMVVTGGFEFLHSYPSKWVKVLGNVMLVALIGLPFTPSALIWKDMISSSGLLTSLWFAVTLGIIFVGTFRHINRSRPQQNDVELWMRFFFVVGLTLLFIVPWLAMTWDFQKYYSAGFQFLSIVGFLVSGFGVLIFLSKLGSKVGQSKLLARPRQGFEIALKAAGVFFEFEWLIRLSQLIFSWTTKPIGFFVTILEGDGGLLWALLILALLSSVIISGGL